jgi:hypothetical protein
MACKYIYNYYIYTYYMLLYTQPGCMSMIDRIISINNPGGYYLENCLPWKWSLGTYAATLSKVGHFRLIDFSGEVDWANKRFQVPLDQDEAFGVKMGGVLAILDLGNQPAWLTKWSKKRGFSWLPTWAIKGRLSQIPRKTPGQTPVTMGPKLETSWLGL